MQRRNFLHSLALFPLGFLGFNRQPPAVPKATLPPEPWELGPEAYAQWRRAPRRPMVADTAPLTRRLAQAIQANQALRFRYDGGSTPGMERRVTPGHLYTVEGFPGVYLSGYCHTRRAERTFLVARMRVGEAG